MDANPTVLVGPTPRALLVALALRRHGSDDWDALAKAAAKRSPGLDALTAKKLVDELSLPANEPKRIAEVVARLKNERLVQLDRAIAAIDGDIASLRAHLAQAAKPPSAAKPAATTSDAVNSAADAAPVPSPAFVSKRGTRHAAEPSPVAEDAVESWVDAATAELQTPRRASATGTLLRMLSSIVKHKWAHPFKRAVTDKEAPDYRDVIKRPMDLGTLKKRVEAGDVADVAALVAGLTLTFSNAMGYNSKGSDYHKMAAELKQITARQHAAYKSWYLGLADPSPCLPKLEGAVAASGATEEAEEAPLAVERAGRKRGAAAVAPQANTRSSRSKR